jgi:hypothetical protein
MSASPLARLTLSHKFLALALMSLLMAAIPSWLYLNEAGKARAAYEAELTGMPAVAPKRAVPPGSGKPMRRSVPSMRRSRPPAMPDWPRCRTACGRTGKAWLPP